MRSVNTDQTGWMPRLVGVFAGCRPFFFSSAGSFEVLADWE